MLKIRNTHELHGYATIESCTIFDGTIVEHAIHPTRRPDLSFRLSESQLCRLLRCKEVNIKYHHSGRACTVYTPNGTMICRLNGAEYVAFILAFVKSDTQHKCNIKESLSDLFS